MDRSTFESCYYCLTAHMSILTTQHPGSTLSINTFRAHALPEVITFDTFLIRHKIKGTMAGVANISQEIVEARIIG